MNENFEKNESDLNYEVIRLLLLNFSNYSDVDKLIKDNPQEYKFYGEVIRPLMDKYVFSDDRLEKHPELFKMFSKIALVSVLEREWVESHIYKYLKNKLSEDVKNYYNVLFKKLNLDSDESFKIMSDHRKEEIENEKIIKDNEDISEDKIYRYVTDKLSKTEWEDYVNSFLDDPKKREVLKNIENKLEVIKDGAHQFARIFSKDKDTNSYEYNRLYEKNLRAMVQHEHIKLIKNND